MDPSARVETLRSQLEDDDRNLAAEDADLVLEFSRRLRLLREEYSDYRHKKLLRHVIRIGEHSGARLTAVVEDRDAAETAVAWIHDNYDNEETNRDYRVALRVFGKRVTEGDDTPDSLSWISTKTSRNYDPTPDGPELLTREDVTTLREAARNSRDAAAISLQFDAGLRGGELYDLQVGDLVDADHGLQVRVRGKEGTRAVTLIPSVPHVRRWLDDHPGDEGDPLWSKLSTPTQLSYKMFLKMFRSAAGRTDIGKDVTPTAFRKANASWLARRGASATLIEDRQGRARGSEAVARYVARFGESTENTQYASLHGEATAEEEPAEVAPLDCPRCGQASPRDEPACMWCGQVLQPEAAQTIDTAESDLLDFMAGEDDADRRETARQLAGRLEDDPELTAELLAELVD